ncbi:MAG: mechanosensitive ion channel family protein [Thermoanaerobaculia bacterium]|nr:mechanosensitive ion channel family protein [Thermoanaerobaculia bacterium]
MQGEIQPESAASTVEETVANAVAQTEKPPELTEAWDVAVHKVEGWGQTAVSSLPNVVVAIVLVVLFVLLSWAVKSLLRRGLKHTPITKPVANLMVAATGFLVVVTGLFIALGILGLDKTVTSLLAGVGILGLALGFAFQDIASNFIAGIILSFRRPAQPGDLVETNDFQGVVQEINLRSTLLRLPTGQVVYIPNKKVFENSITNYSQLGVRRVDVEVGVSYGDDLEAAHRLAVDAVEALDLHQPDHPVQVFFREFGDSSINLDVQFWIEFGEQSDYLAAKSAAILAIKRAFDDGGITIPFPIRTLDIPSSGGKAVEAVLPSSPGEDS